ncbi:MAG: MFS transporter [Anaerolineae bacterium]|nr:MFS transporter [Anaerolineae bacterium]
MSKDQRQNPLSHNQLFGNRNFMALWIGQTISFVGDYFYWLATPIMVERLTGSTVMVGLSVIFNALPMLLLGPVAGVFVDRWDRKRTMIVADLLRALLVLLCLLVQRPEQVWIYYLVGFSMSCVSRFFFPSQNAVLPLIVPDQNQLLAANGLMQMVQTVGLVVGPALAGFSIALWGERVAFLADSLTFLLSAAAILTIAVPRTTQGRQVAGRRLAAVWNEMVAGAAYMFGSATMVGVLICLAAVQLGIGAINVAWIPFMQRTFGLEAEGLGAVDASQGVGMVIGAAVLGTLMRRFSKRQMAGWGIVGIGVAIGLIGLAPPFSLVDLFPTLQVEAAVADLAMGERLLRMPLLLLLYSVALGVALVPAQSALITMMQLAVPDLKRGRVGSVLNALTTAAGLISMAAAAAFGEAIGLRTVYVLSGSIVAVAGVLGLVVLRDPESHL